MLWVKSFHIIFVIAWYAGLFYLPRLFVYHAMAEDKLSKDRFVVMEKRLYWWIMIPSLILMAAFGFWVIGYYGLESAMHMGWLHVKLVLVAFLVGYHFWLGHQVKILSKGIIPYSHVFYRVMNEVPTVFLIVIVCLAVVKPF